jgi:hypothetical protein
MTFVSQHVNSGDLNAIKGQYKTNDSESPDVFVGDRIYKKQWREFFEPTTNLS